MKVLSLAFFTLLCCAAGYAQTLTKTSNISGAVVAGQTYTVTLKVKASTWVGAPATFPYTITDVLPPDLILVSGGGPTFTGSLASGAQATHTYTVKVAPGSTACSFDNNSACPLFLTWGNMTIEGTSNSVVAVPAGSMTLKTNVATSSLGTNLTGSYRISGTLNVDQNTTMNGCLLEMMPGSQIVVQPGKKLTLNGTTIHGCQAMWQGIYVRSSGSLRGSVECRNATHISDARTALWMQDGTSLNISDSYFENNFIAIYVPPRAAGVTAWQSVPGTITRTIFTGGTLLPRYLNCGPLYYEVASANGPTLVHVRAEAFAGVVALECSSLNWFSANGKPTGSAITTFGGLHTGINATLSADIATVAFESIYPKTGYAVASAGIYITVNQKRPNVPVMPVLKVHGFGSQTTSQPLFKDCYNAIVTNFHGMDIQNGYYQNIQSMGILIECFQSAAPSAILVANNYIDMYALGNPATAIYLFGESDAPTDIRYNTLKLNRQLSGTLAMKDLIGIYHAGIPVDEVLIRHNTVHLYKKGIGIYLTSIAGAISPNDGAGYTVHVTSNDIRLYNDFPQRAIALEGTITAGATSYIDVQHNTITGPSNTIGNSATTGIELSLANNINVTCNSTDKTPTGIGVKGACSPSVIQGHDFYAHTVALKFSGSGIIGVQNHTGNRWNSTYTWAIQNGGSPSTSQFKINQALGAPYWPPPAKVTGGAGIFGGIMNNLSTAPLIDCSSQATGTNLRPLAITALDLAVATGQYEAPEYTEETLWMMQQDLYQWLIANPAVWATDSIIGAFVDSVENQPLGQLATLGDSPVSVVSPTVLGQLEAAALLLAAKEHEIWLADSLIADGPDDPLELQNRAALQLEYEQLLHFADSLNQIVLEGRQEEADSLRARLDRINATEVYEQNQQTVNSLYLSTFAAGTRPNAAQREQLMAIATQCPMAGGRAVYHARALLIPGADSVPHYNDDSLCLAQGILWRPGKSQPEALQGSVVIAPNPANDLLTITNPTETPVTFVLYDLAGKVLVIQPVAAGEHTVLDLKDFASGVYPWMVSGEAVHHAGKTVIAH